MPILGTSTAKVFDYECKCLQIQILGLKMLKYTKLTSVASVIVRWCKYDEHVTFIKQVTTFMCQIEL